MSDQNNCCRGNTKQGRPCRAAATESGYCFFHTSPGLAAELGRAGGRKNRHVIDETLPPLPAMDTVTGVRGALGLMIADVYGNRLDPKKAAGLAPLLNTLLRALGTEDIEHKFKQMEARLNELSNAVTAVAANKTKEDNN